MRTPRAAIVCSTMRSRASANGSRVAAGRGWGGRSAIGEGPLGSEQAPRATRSRNPTSTVTSRTVSSLAGGELGPQRVARRLEGARDLLGELLAGDEIARLRGRVELPAGCGEPAQPEDRGG